MIKNLGKKNLIFARKIGKYKTRKNGHEFHSSLFARSTLGAFRMKAPPTRNTTPRCRPQVLPPKTVPTWHTIEAQPRKAAFDPSAAHGLQTRKKAAPTSRRLPPLDSSRARRKRMDPAQGNQKTFQSAIPADLSRTKVSLHTPSRPKKARQPHSSSLWAQ